MTKIKIALAALLVAGTASVAMADSGEFDPNLANRYPGFAAPGAQSTGTLQSAPVGLYQGNGQQYRGNTNDAPARAGGVG